MGQLSLFEVNQVTGGTNLDLNIQASHFSPITAELGFSICKQYPIQNQGLLLKSTEEEKINILGLVLRSAGYQTKYLKNEIQDFISREWIFL